MARKKKEDGAEEAKKTSKKAVEIRVGSVIELKNEHKCMSCTFPAGTKVLVTGETAKGYNINNNPDCPKMGFEMIECGFDL